VPTAELGEPLVERVDRVLDAPGRCETERTRDAWPTRSSATCAAESGTPERLRTDGGRAFLERLQLPADARERIEIALAMVDAIEQRIAPLERELRQLARRQTGCQALMGLLARVGQHDARGVGDAGGVQLLLGGRHYRLQVGGVE
jgi:hypothetical protein